jgi:hypothetical protein
MITFRVSLTASNFEKHITYRFSMENGYSFIELGQCNENVTDTVRRSPPMVSPPYRGDRV